MNHLSLTDILNCGRLVLGSTDHFLGGRFSGDLVFKHLLQLVTEGGCVIIQMFQANTRSETRTLFRKVEETSRRSAGLVSECRRTPIPLLQRYASRVHHPANRPLRRCLSRVHLVVYVIWHTVHESNNSTVLCIYSHSESTCTNGGIRLYSEVNGRVDCMAEISTVVGNKIISVASVSRRWYSVFV